MDYKSRLEKLEKIYLIKKDLYSKPDFKNYSDEGLVKHITDSIERTHKQEHIKSLADGLAYYNRICESGGISEEEKKLFLEMEKEYWDGILNLD